MNAAPKQRLFGDPLMDPDVDERLPLAYFAGTLDPAQVLHLYPIHFALKISVLKTLTLEMLIERGRCVVTILSNHKNPDIETWYHLWEAVTALKDMCARVGKRGIAVGYGKLECRTILRRFLLVVWWIKLIEC